MKTLLGFGLLLLGFISCAYADLPSSDYELASDAVWQSPDKTVQVEGYKKLDVDAYLWQFWVFDHERKHATF